jgi:hypothetical protein
MAWNPQPALGGALWSGNASLATTRQLLSTSSGIISTINTNNDSISSLNISTGNLRAGFASIDQVSTGNITGSGYLGSLLIGDPDDGGIVQIASKFEIRNTAVGASGLFIIDATQTSINWGAGGISFNGSPWAPINPVGTFTSLTAPVAYIQGLSSLTLSTNTVYAAGLSSLTLSTGSLRAGAASFDSISTLFFSTGTHTGGNATFDSISSLRLSTGTARIGVASVGTLTAGSATLSGNLDMCNNNISNVATLTATTVNAGTVGATAGNFTTLSGTLTGNVNGNLTGNVVGNISNTNLTVSGQYSITETADVGSAISNYANYGTVNITGKGGLGGIVNITADVATPLNPAVTVSQLTAEAKGNYGLITPGSPVGYVPRGGLVSIIARQGLTPTPPAEVTSALFANGEIDLTAYSYGIVPGLIKLNSGANAMYAGAISPLTGIFGNNYIFGQFGNSILAALPPGGVPNVPGENYIYGLTGTVIDNGLYTDTIYNKFGGNLNLDSRTSNINITSSNTGGSLNLTSPTITLTGSSAINLTGNPTISGNLDMTDGNINNVAIISARPGSNMTIQNQESFLFFPTTALIYATGGTITESGGRTFHTFTTNGTFTLNYSVGTIEVALIGGGGGGGGVNGGGGGAGNAIIATSTLTPDTYTVTIGAGGAGGTASSIGGNGTQSRFANGSSSVNVRALGGGGGATTGVGGGANGGCGGGGAEGTESLGGSAGPGVITGMTGVFNSATSGGFNPNPANFGTAGSGGGGSQSIGLNVSAITPSDGGDGGTATLYYGTYYGGGGGGAAAPTGVYGAPKKGRGGGTAPPTSGGNGSLGATTTQAEPGVANTGGGGGGGEDATGGYPGAAGGSGIVIVSYLTPPNERFTMGTSEEIFLSSLMVTVSNDFTVLGTTNIQATTVSTITATNISTIGTAAFAGDVYMTGLSTVISRLFISDTKQIETFVMVQGGTTNAGSYSINSAQNNVIYNGQQFPVSDWNCSASLAGFSIPQPYATNQAYVVATNVGGFWNIQSYMGLATLPGGGVGVQWTIRLVMTPRGIAGPNQLSAEAPSTLSSTDFALNIPLTFMSSITASTMTLEANRNISLLANIAPPSYISTGNITVAGTNAVDILGNVVALGGVTDVDIEALTGDVNIVAASTISLTAPTINLVGTVGSTINITCSTINLEGTVYTSGNLSVSTITDVATINGVAYTPFSGSGVWTSTATTALNMNGYNITAGSTQLLSIGTNTTAPNAISFSNYGGNLGDIKMRSYNIDIGDNQNGTIAIRSGGAGYAIIAAGNIRLEGTVDMFSNDINNVKTIDFLGGNIATGSNFLDINGAGLGTFTSMKSGNTYYTIDTVGNPTVNALSTNQVTISQTAGSDFVLFNNGDTRMNAKRNAYMQGDVSVYIDALQDSYLKARSNVVLETTTGYINLVAQGGSNGIYCTGAFTELRGYLTFNAANNYINNLEHIYGDTSAPGGGLAIDYMYGLFFNSPGKNANLYIDAGNLNMINYNSGINIANYNSNGTGNLSLYSASNDMYLGTGAGRDININGGRYVSVNAAQPGGSFGIYASTINATSLLDTNITANRNMTLTAGGSLVLTSPNQTYFDNGGFVQFNVDHIYMYRGYLNMNGAPISNVVGVVGSASSDLSIAANGARNLLFTGSNIQTTAFGTIDLTSYGDMNLNTSFSNDIVINSDGNLTLQAARAGCNVSIYSPDVFITGTSNVIINTKYSTWTGSNNFNILGSNIGITSSNAFDIVATGSGLILDGEFKRKLITTNITQPILQYEYVSTASAFSGTVTVTLPQRYTSVTSYIPFAVVTNDATTTFYVSTITRATFEIGWSGYTGFSDIVFSWNTMGT